MTTVETGPVLHSAKLLERALIAILLVLLVATAIVSVMMIFDATLIGQTLAGAVGYGAAQLSGPQSFGLGGLLIFQMCIWIAVIWSGKEIFAALGDGDARSASFAAGRTARILWFMLVWGIIAHMLGTLIATWNFPEGQRAVGISIGSAQISTAFAALLATFTSHAFVLGAALWQDHKEVI